MQTGSSGLITNIVIVEKPFTPTSEEAYELIEIAKQNQRIIAVYQSEPPCLAD